MLFNSLDFAIFLPIVFVLYWLLKSIKHRNILILFSSLIFYCFWDWRFLSLIFLSSIIDFWVSRKIHEHQDFTIKKKYLFVSVFVNIGILILFKYFDFFISNFISTFNFFGFSFNYFSLNLILPVGISFYTFQTLSYSIDVYRKKITPINSFITFFSFVSFFPQLVAGPIERAKNLLPQFQIEMKFSFKDFKIGTNYILWGLFKKVVIADRLGIFVNEIYNNVFDYNGFTLIIATIFFSFQVYCDFSGYSNIAIGVARLFGFRLMKNFEMPFFSKSIDEFWRKWHISLSTWFNDYLFTSLALNFRGLKKIGVYISIFITFLIAGLWHGAGWTFVIFGVLHGLYFFPIVFFNKRFKSITSNNSRKSSSNKFFSLIAIIFNFSIVCFAFIFFRSNNLLESLHIIKNIFDLSSYKISQLSLYIVPTLKNTVFSIDIFLCYFLISVLLFSEFFNSYVINFYKLKFYLKSILYVLCILSLFLIGVYEKNEFIYFQF